MSKRQTKEQERAKYAWECVEKAQATLRKDASEYGQLARGLPAFIQTNGLGQTLAFLLSKGKNDSRKPHQQLYLHLSEWTTEQLGWGKSDKLMQELTRPNHDSNDYRRATNEVMALLIWLRRFAEAQLIKDDKQEGNDATTT